MNSLTSYDLKQIILIRKRIELFENEKLDLFDFISDLSGLLNAMTSVNEFWRNNFQTLINTLEIIHDSIEDGSISRWQGNYKEDMRNAISKLNKMTTCLLEEYLKKPDPNILERAIEEGSNWLICPKCHNAWKSSSLLAMVICPNCMCALHNPLFFTNSE